MKLVFCYLLIVIFAPCSLFAQNKIYIYKVNQTYSNTQVGYKEKKTVTFSLPYTGYVFQKGKRYLSYLKPNYIKDTRIVGKNGYFDYYNENISPDSGQINSMIVDMDSLQWIFYTDFDSLVSRDHEKSSAMDIAHNYIQYFQPNFEEWNILPDRKKINGYDCQRASLSIRGYPQWEIWYSLNPGDSILAGPFNIKYPPRLVVEAKMIPMNTTYVLSQIIEDAGITDGTLWPAEFNQSDFETLGTLQKNIPQSDDEKKRIKKRELLNENN